MCLPCAGGPNSGRKSDAQKTVSENPGCAEARARSALIQFLSDKKKSNKTSMHALRRTGKHKKKYIYFFLKLHPQPVCFFRLRYALIHAGGPHHESRRGERRVSALNDRCLLLLLLFSPPFPSLSLSCSSGVSTRILCNVDTMTDGARRKKKRKRKKKAGAHCSTGWWWWW